jgi:hypothetical protein
LTTPTSAGLLSENMKSSDIFGVVVRTVGLLVIIWSLWQILGGIDNFLENLFPGGSDSESLPTFPYFLYGIPAFVLGTLCFFLADWIVKLAYRE